MVGDGHWAQSILQARVQARVRVGVLGGRWAVRGLEAVQVRGGPAGGLAWGAIGSGVGTGDEVEVGVQRVFRDGTRVRPEVRVRVGR